MKIPLYRRQTQMTRDSGGRPLSAFASPSDYAAPANAAFQQGAAIAGAGRALGDIAVTEAKQENATLQAAEEAKFADFVFQTQQEALTGPVGQSQKVPANPNLPANYPNALRLMVNGPAETQQQHVTRVQRSLAEQISRQAARIGDKDVRRRFTASAQATMRSSLPGLSATYRTRYLDRHRATMNQSDVSMRRHVGTLKGLPRQEQINKHVDRIREDGANQFETEVNINARVQKFLSGTEEDLVRQEIVTIERMDDKQQERAYDNLFIRLNDNEQFRNLEQDDRIKLQKFVANQSERAGTSYANRINRETAQNEKKRKVTQVATYESLQKRILDYRQYAMTGEGDPVNPVTEADISGMREVTKPMRDSLRKMMRGEDTIYNPKLYKDLLDQVDEAVTDEDLEAIREDVTDYNLDGQLGGLAAQEIQKQIDDLKTKTPDALERQRYRNALKQALGANATRFQSRRTDETLREAEIINFYNDQLQRGVLPGVAYVDAIERGKAKTKENVTALVQSLPPQLYNLFKFGKNNKIQLPGDDKKTEPEQKAANDEFISKTQTTMLEYLRDQIAGIERKYDLEIDGVVDTQQDIEFTEGMDPSRKTPQQLGEQQRLKDKEKRLTKKDRMTVRQLFTLERRIEQIITTLKKAADDGFIDPRVLDGGGNDPEGPNQNRGN